MPNIASLLKAEIVRLSRREIRAEIAGMKKAVAQGRRDMIEQKRRLAELSRQVNRLGRGLVKAEAPVKESGAKARFTAKGLRTQRKRLGLSAAEYGQLIGVSAQSIYKWEREEARPRKKQIQSLASVRGLGKKEARARLAGA